MPRRFFRQFSLKRDQLSDRWYTAPFQHVMSDPRLFHVSRRSVVPAVAIGFFYAWFPLPGQMLVATLTAIGLRANIPIAALATFISNPVTMSPMYYLGYRVGAAILQTPRAEFGFEFSWTWISNSLQTYAQPLFVGCLVLATATAAATYVALNIIWRMSVAANAKARRLRRIRRLTQAARKRP